MFITYHFFNHKFCNSELKLNCSYLRFFFFFRGLDHVWQTANVIFMNMSMKSSAAIRTLQAALYINIRIILLFTGKCNNTNINYCLAMTEKS